MQLAQLNIGRTVAPIDSPELAGFVEALDRINTLGEQSPGFVWRLKDDGSDSSETGDATTISLYGDPLRIPNLTVWESAESLHEFAYKTEHVDFFKRRAEWFEKPAEAYFVMWWVPDGHRPTIDEALKRLEHLQANGPTERAFTFANRFPAPQA